MGAEYSSHVSVREGEIEIEIEKSEKNQQMCGQKLGLIGYDNAGSDAQGQRERGGGGMKSEGERGRDEEREREGR